MQIIQIFFGVLYFFSICKCDISPRVLDAVDADIEDFPYNGFLAIKYKGDIYSHICGSSILSQIIVISAGHCFSDCTRYSTIFLYVGDAVKLRGEKVKISAYTVHGDYNELELSNDIGLARVEHPLTFNSKISRVSLMREPPYYEEALVAGWGLIAEDRPIFARTLQYMKQQVRPATICYKLLHNGGSLQKGTICATNKKSIASRGDSGSPLVVRGYIQIGLVSYKPLYPTEGNENVVVYTDTGYHYKWIKHAAYHLTQDCTKNI